MSSLTIYMRPAMLRFPADMSTDRGILVHSIETPVHGRILMRAAQGASTLGILVGYHGYAESADLHLERLAGIPGTEAWIVLSVQALNRFYRSRTDETVASWMTRQDRELAIAANVIYANRAIERARREFGPGSDPPVVHAGFSQGGAMAFRAAVLGGGTAAGVISVGADVPPELLADPLIRFPPVLLARGVGDEWYTASKFDADVAALAARAVKVTPRVFKGGHEWTPEIAAHAAAFLAALH